MLSVKDEFRKAFNEVMTAEPKGGVRLQKKMYVRSYNGESFTVTIERGDWLNNIHTSTSSSSAKNVHCEGRFSFDKAKRRSK